MESRTNPPPPPPPTTLPPPPGNFLPFNPDPNPNLTLIQLTQTFSEWGNIIGGVGGGQLSGGKLS